MIRSGRFGGAMRIAEYAVAVALSAYLCLHTLPRACNSLNTDFPNYYLAARVAHEGVEASRAYEWIWLQRQKDHRDIDQSVVALVPITPFSTLVMWPVTSLPPLKAKHVWLVVNLALLAAIAFLLRSITGLTLLRITILIGLSFPLHRNFLYGQYYIVLLCILTAACWACIQRRRALAGSLVGIGIAVKIFPIMLCFYFLRKREWRSLAACVVASVAATLCSISVFGWSLHRTYMREVLPWTLRGDCLDPYNLASASISSLLHRLFIYEPQWNPHPALTAPWLFAILHPVLQMAILGPVILLIGRATGSNHDEIFQRERIALEWAALLLATLTISPLPASYHFTVLILPMTILAGYLMKRREWSLLAAVLILYLCVGFPGWSTNSADGLRALLHVPRLYAMILLTGTSLYVLSRSSVVDRDVHGLLWKFALTAMVIFSVSLGLRHQRGLFADYIYRVPMPKDALLAAQPQSSEDGIHFIALVPEGYRDGSISDASANVSSTREDEPSFASVAGQAQERRWIESAGRNSLLRSVASQGLQIEAAQSPAISADGRTLAYLREIQGRNAIFVRRLGQLDTAEQQISLPEPSLNVSEMTLLQDGSLVFSASTRNAAFNLYRVDRDGAIENLALGEARYPAASSDGRWMAYSRFEQGAWNLWLLELVSGKAHRITTVPCNQIEPAWEADSKTLLYGSDCGRALWFTAICRRRVLP